ncbi:Type I secretion system membrane fusion protein PrsE [Andreprevotia sp. IGB-42]|uniref:HlyD family type I secretion periplasmic adaptor subunit n=1 Tax=Andreprevotia sp. IGB-42 TaxID=2497473 RepID=UPI001359FB48|nr:HlyD family type I secretion periplasmic adaptor subunit [Andreprevotia sp. IGB-42]KAF0812506.1 Type I secretion system membrane fusion protein PrsE [Andreprevotia sp. IGB-42]
MNAPQKKQVRRSWWQRLRHQGSRTVDKLMQDGDNRHGTHSRDFIGDADWAIAEHNPRGSRLLVWLSALALLCLIIWAALSPIDEVARGEGKVIPSRQVQIVQSLDGGIVEKILVREGQLVEKGQMLIKIDPTRFVSSLKENRAQYLSLKAKAAQLDAIASGKAFVPPPDVMAEAPELVTQEQSLYLSKRAELEAGMGVARQQLAQRSQEMNEVRARRDQASQSLDLTVRELDATRPLLKSGAVSDVDILRLERDVARFRGERDAANAQLPRIQSSMAEASSKINEVDLTFRNQAKAELSETLGKLGSLTEGSVGLQDRVKQSDIRSPVRGTVKTLLFNTVGGVVQPGKDVIEIVPSDDALLLEARVAPRDIAFLRPGQKALVKFTAYDFATYGGLEAKLEHISADTVTDEKGNAFFLVRVRTNSSFIGDKKLPIIPGMVAEVDILTGKRSILAYLLKPVLRAKANAMTER